VLLLVAATFVAGWLRPLVARLAPGVFAWPRAWRIVLLAHGPSLLLAAAVVALTARLERCRWRAAVRRIAGPRGRPPERRAAAAVLLTLGGSIAWAVAATGLRLGLSPDAPALASQFLVDIGFREEVVFRGFAFRQLRRRWSFRAAAAGSSLLFWLIHLPKYAEEWRPGSPPWFVALKYGFPLAFSFASASLLERGQTLWTCILFHLAVDYGYLLRINEVGEPGPWPTALVLALGQWAAVIAILVLYRPRGRRR